MVTFHDKKCSISWYIMTCHDKLWNDSIWFRQEELEIKTFISVSEKWYLILGDLTFTHSVIVKNHDQRSQIWTLFLINKHVPYVQKTGSSLNTQNIELCDVIEIVFYEYSMPSQRLMIITNFSLSCTGNSSSWLFFLVRHRFLGFSTLRCLPSVKYNFIGQTL